MTQTDRDTPDRIVLPDPEPGDFVEGDDGAMFVVKAAETDRDTPVTALREAAREVVRFYGTDRTWSLMYRTLLGSRIDDLRTALASSDDVAGSGERLVDITGVDAIRRAVVAEMENEGVVTWGDAGHRARFLAPTTEAPPKDAPEGDTS